MWDLIVSVTDHCLSFYFDDVISQHTHCDVTINLVTEKTQRIYSNSKTGCLTNNLRSQD